MNAAKSDADKDEAQKFETINQASPSWVRPRSEISDEEYQTFYQHVSHDFGEALTWTHNRVEGNQNFVSLLYVPARPPFDMLQGGREERHGLKQIGRAHV